METSTSQTANLETVINSDESRRNDLLWQMAKKRVGFKWGLMAYFFVNTFLVCVWYFSSRNHNTYFWPIWPMLGWGLGLAFHYFDAYHGNKLFSTEQEYQKLKNEQNR
jgi:hypothetical protein